MLSERNWHCATPLPERLPESQTAAVRWVLVLLLPLLFLLVPV